MAEGTSHGGHRPLGGRDRPLRSGRRGVVRYPPGSVEEGARPGREPRFALTLNAAGPKTLSATLYLKKYVTRIRNARLPDNDLFCTDLIAAFDLIRTCARVRFALSLSPLSSRTKAGRVWTPVVPKKWITRKSRWSMQPGAAIACLLNVPNSFAANLFLF